MLDENRTVASEVKSKRVSFSGRQEVVEKLYSPQEKGMLIPCLTVTSGCPDPQCSWCRAEH